MPVARVLPALLVLALLGATAAAFAVTEGLKLEKTPIERTRVDQLFSPVCACATDHARIRFWLRTPDRLTVTIRSGSRTVDTLVAGRSYRRGWVRLAWDGVQPTGLTAPDGVYYPVVHLARKHWTIELPNPIQVDTTPPRVTRATAKPLALSPDGDGHGDVLTVRYRLSEHAHAELFVGRRRAVLTRFARPVDVLRWYGRIGERALAPGSYPLELGALDLAGNQAKRLRLGTLTIRYVSLGRPLVSVGPGERFAIRVSADAPTVAYRFAGRTGTVRPGTNVFRAPKRLGLYRLAVSVGGHAATAKVKVERIP